MILTSEHNKGIISHIKSVTLNCNDLGELVVDGITDYDMEFNRSESSYVELTHCFIDKHIITKYVKNIKVIHIKIVMEIYNTESNKSETSCLDIPCDMKITTLKYHGSPESISNCFIRLEGLCE